MIINQSTLPRESFITKAAHLYGYWESADSADMSTQGVNVVMPPLMFLAQVLCVVRLKELPSMTFAKVLDLLTISTLSAFETGLRLYAITFWQPFLLHLHFRDLPPSQSAGAGVVYGSPLIPLSFDHLRLLAYS